MDRKFRAASQVVEECFWGDYKLSAHDILDRLESKDGAFGRFLFSTINENSRFPSKHLTALFDQKDLLPMLERYLSASGSKRRIRLVAANITSDYDLVREYQWKR